MRVHRQGLAGADPEDTGVEVGRVVQEAALRPEHPAGVLGIGQLDVAPAPVRGERRHAVAAVRDQLPQLLGRAHPTGETAAHADDRDRFLLTLFDLAQSLAGVAQVGGHALQEVPELVLVVHNLGLASRSVG
ncbi:hypothetical protein GCM10010434_086730 [Winogradskya humida]